MVRIRAQNLCDGGQPHVAITVEDDGPGIPLTLREHIFDPYYTTIVHGHGLELAIAMAIAQQHGGQLTVGDSPLRGAELTLTLPGTTELVLPREVPSPRTVAPFSGTVLIVDDNVPVRATAQALVQSFGLQIATVGDGASSSAWLSEQACDLVLLDWVLGGAMKGHEVLEAIRRRCSHIPVVVSSGYDDVSIPAGTPLLPKPYTRQHLGRVLAAILTPGR